MTALSACEWIFAGRPVADILVTLSAAGCDALEVSGEPGRADRRELPAVLEAAGMGASGITAICPWPTAERDLASPEGAVRRRAVDYYRACVDLAGEVGAPAIGLIPAPVGRLDALTTTAREWGLAVDAARAVAEYAGERGVAVGVEAINRYESFLVRTAADALDFAAAVGEPNVGVVLDAYHMNIEEQDPRAAVVAAVPSLLALHLADSNRLGIGHGHLDITGLVGAARDAGYRGPLVFEFNAPGPNPFQPRKPDAVMPLLDVYAAESAAAVRATLAQEAA